MTEHKGGALQIFVELKNYKLGKLLIRIYFEIICKFTDHLERHLMSLHEDNHQMSERIAEAEDLIRDLDSDKRFDGSPAPGFEKQNKQVW